MKQKYCYVILVLVCLRAIPGLGAGRNHVLDTSHHPGSVERHISSFLERSAEVYNTLHYLYKQVIATHKDGHLIGNLTQPERFHFRDRQPSCRVAHCNSRGVSTQATSPTL